MLSGFLAGFIFAWMMLQLRRRPWQRPHPRPRRLQTPAFERFQPPGRRVDVGGFSLYVHYMGEPHPGQPTVVLEAGHADWSHCWRKVQPQIARFARVCAYDRAGFGWSDAGPRPRTPERIVAELHALLERSGAQKPYLLVGHSMGAALARLYQRTYPGEVVGMVWVDSAHEDMPHFVRIWRAAGHALMLFAPAGALLARTGLLRQVGRHVILAGYPAARTRREQAVVIEQVAAERFFDVIYDETAALLRASHWPGAGQPAANLPAGGLPVVMIEADYPRDLTRGVFPRQWAEFRQGWRHMQDDLHRLAPASQRIRVSTGHNVMDEQPEVIVDAVRAVLQAIQANQEAS